MIYDFTPPHQQIFIENSTFVDFLLTVHVHNYVDNTFLQWLSITIIILTITPSFMNLLCVKLWKDKNFTATKDTIIASN